MAYVFPGERLGGGGLSGSLYFVPTDSMFVDTMFSALAGVPRCALLGSNVLATLIGRTHIRATSGRESRLPDQKCRVRLRRSEERYRARGPKLRYHSLIIVTCPSDEWRLSASRDRF